MKTKKTVKVGKKVLSVFLCFLLILYDFYSSLSFASTPQCLQPSDALLPPQFNSETGYCETFPLSGTGACPEGYIFSPTIEKCVAFPYCEGGYFYSFSTKSCEVITFDSSNETSDSGSENCTTVLTAKCNVIDLRCREGYKYDSERRTCRKWLGWPCNETQNQRYLLVKQGNCFLGFFFYSPPPYRGHHLEKIVLQWCVDSPNRIECCFPNAYFNVFMKNYADEIRTITTTESQPLLCDACFFVEISGSDLEWFYYDYPLYPRFIKVEFLSEVLNRDELCYWYNITGCNDASFITLSITYFYSEPCLEEINCPLEGTYAPDSGYCWHWPMNPDPPICPEGYTQVGPNSPYKYLCVGGCPFPGVPCTLQDGEWVCSTEITEECSGEQPGGEDDEPDLVPGGLEDDGEISEDGTCLGTVYIFNGKKMRCRKPGIQTGFQNCCDEAQGKIYDDTGSLHGTFKTVKSAIAAISAAKQVVKVGYYAIKIAEGAYVFDSVTGTLFDVTSQKVVTTFSTTSAEAKALASVAEGMNLDVAVQTAGMEYLKNLDPNVVASIVGLATSMLIDDPILQATVNLAAQIAIPLLFGTTPNPVGLALAVLSLIMALLGGGCDEQDVLTSTLKESGYCHYVGDRCTKKFLGTCLQKIKVYCCFNSKLARIIHEQGRPQLKTFNGWGSAKNPVCRGFTPEEFQALDFSKMDLSEYYADIERNVAKDVQQKITTQVEETYQGLRR